MERQEKLLNLVEKFAQIERRIDAEERKSDKVAQKHHSREEPRDRK